MFDVVISLKKLIESDRGQLVESALAGYRSAVDAVAANGARACPSVGGALQSRLSGLRDRLAGHADSATLEQTGREIQDEIERWGHGAAEYLQDRTRDVKEIMLVLAQTAESLGERDQRYTGEFQHFTGRLESIAGLDDLRAIRSSLLESATALKACAEAMARDGRESLQRLSREVDKYQTRLEEVERLAHTDGATGLANRLGLERAIECRIPRRFPFSVILLDLNGFKRINDTHGHPVGDEVLKQFGAELQGVFRATDVVGRWGGDEFLVAADCGPPETDAYVDRIRTWTFGEYTVSLSGRTCKCLVRASIGVAIWRDGDSAASLVARADAAMYRDKQRADAAR